MRCAFWLAFSSINDGQWAIAGGWLARARRMLGAGGEDRPEHGYLLLCDAMRHAAAGRYERVGELAERAAEIGDRHRDAELTALARTVQGRAAIGSGDVEGGVGLLDEAMLAVTTDDVSPVVTMTVYCGLIESCMEIFDLDRAREWTAALPAQVWPQRGRCLVHRAEILRQSGDWPAAAAQAKRAIAAATGDAAQPIAGAAHNVLADVYRLQGSLEAAEDAYRRASVCGHQPEPGWALLRLARGDVTGANAIIRRAVGEARDAPNRATLLAAFVEIVLAADDVPAARVAAGELEDIAERVDTPYLHAMSQQAAGAVLLAGRQPIGALGRLRHAGAIWRKLGVPYGLARCRTLVGLACRELGDEDTARLELDAAESLYRRLGAAVVNDLGATTATVATSGRLTRREVDVLRLVAGGLTNRAVAAELGLSEKTIARHMSNILTKLGLRSRSAATAYAYQHRLV